MTKLSLCRLLNYAEAAWRDNIRNMNRNTEKEVAELNKAMRDLDKLLAWPDTAAARGITTQDAAGQMAFMGMGMAGAMPPVD